MGQWDEARLPLKPLPYSNKDLASCNEVIIDYLGDKPSYNIYITDSEDPKKLINITDLIINQMLPNEVNANNFYVTIEGLEDNQKLREIINFIYKNFLMPEDRTGFNIEEDLSKITDPTTKNVLLKDTDGTIYLPVTTLGNIIDESGVSLQERLDNMTRLGFSTLCVRADQDNQTSFEFDYPFADYSKYGNYIEVRIGSVYIDKSRYEIIDEVSDDGTVVSATINFIDDVVENGRGVYFLFIYNAKSSVGGRLETVSGGSIANNSIPMSKLEKVSDSYLLNDSTSIATSKAIYNLFMDCLNNLDQSKSAYYYDISPADILYYDEWHLENGLVCNIIASSAKDLSKGLQIYTTNDEPDIKALFTATGEVPTTTLPPGKMIRVLYQDNKFYILNDNPIKTSRFVYTCIDQETEIQFGGLHYEYGSIINVYRNGVRLFEDVDYYMDLTKETITLFVRTEEGERIIFESIYG